MAIIEAPIDPFDPVSLGLAPFDQLLTELSDDGRLVHVERQPARPAVFADTGSPIDPAVADALGVERLYSHQARAIDLIREKQSVVVATGTASGKSRCYQIPIAEAAGRRGGTGTALLLFPTKALAQDQLRALLGFGFPASSPAPTTAIQHPSNEAGSAQPQTSC